MGGYLGAKCEVSSMVLTSFRQGGALTQPPTPPQNEPLKSPPRLGLNYLSNFWRSRNLSLIKYQIELDLYCSKDCTKSEKFAIAANPVANPPTLVESITATIEATLQINSSKLGFPLVILSINNKIKFLER